MAYSKEIVEYHKICNSKDSIETWCAILTDIQDFCFRELQALQIVKMEYLSLPHNELRQKVISKLQEQYTPREFEMSVAEMLIRQIEECQFIDNCKRMSDLLTPL